MHFFHAIILCSYVHLFLGFLNMCQICWNIFGDSLWTRDSVHTFIQSDVLLGNRLTHNTKPLLTVSSVVVVTSRVIWEAFGSRSVKTFFRFVRLHGWGLISQILPHPPSCNRREVDGSRQSSTAPYCTLFAQPRPRLSHPIKSEGFDLNPSGHCTHFISLENMSQCWRQKTL